MTVNPARTSLCIHLLSEQAREFLRASVALLSRALNLKEHPRPSVQFAQELPFNRSVSLLLFMALLLGGCSARRSPGISWANAIQARPIAPEHASGLEDSPEAPVFHPDTPPLAAVLVPVHTVPLRPRSSAPAPVAPVAEPEKREAPKIAPQLTPGETVTARQETSQSLDIAEKNLASTRGRTLNPSQADLVSKIKGFLKDAREAAQAGDWSRARSLAKKAEVLSAALVESP